jgi:hypothetical protein
MAYISSRRGHSRRLIRLWPIRTAAQKAFAALDRTGPIGEEELKPLTVANRELD